MGRTGKPSVLSSLASLASSALAAREVPRHGAVVPGARDTLVAHLVADAILAKVLPRLAREGVVAMPVKGVVTARELYADVSERPITDIDLRVTPEQLAIVARIGREERWEKLKYSKPYGNVVFRMNDFYVDVESAVGPPGLCALRVSDMIARATLVQSSAGYAYLRPELHDHAILLCVNAFKDKLVRAAPWALRDVELVAARPEFDPRRFVLRAREARVTSLVWIVADWMARTRESAAWEDVRARIGRAPRPAYARLFGALLARDDNSLPLRLLARAGSDSPVEQVRALVTALMWEVDTQRKRRASGGGSGGERGERGERSEPHS